MANLSKFPASVLHAFRNLRRVIAVGFLAAIVTLAASESRAAIVNGSFENGFTGWTNHRVVDASPWVNPLLVPGTGTIYTRSQLGQLTPTDATKFAVLEVELVRYDEFVSQVGGARISQSFSAQANDLLSFDLAGSSYATLAKGGAYLNGVEIVPLSLANGDFSETWSHHQFRLPQTANYNLSFAVEQVNQDPWESLGSRIAIDNVRLLPYGEIENPILPTSTGVTPGGIPVFNFNGAQSGQWFDPPATSGFSYQMTSGSLFTKILDFPSGFNSPFVVSVDGSPVGQFGPGQSVDFTGFAGGGVSSFQVSGINPTVDSEDPMAFPLKLQFSTTTADFTMQAVVPEPSTLVLVLCGAAGLALCGWRKRGRARLTCPRQ